MFINNVEKKVCGGGSSRLGAIDIAQTTHINHAKRERVDIGTSAHISST